MIFKRLVQNLCYKLIYPPLYLLSMMSYFISNLLIGQVLFFLAYRIFRYRYLVIAQNISRSFPEKSYHDVEQLIKAYYQHLATMIVELLKPQEKPQLSLFIADQYPGKNTKCVLPFLNQTTMMFNGAEKLARATNAVVVYADIVPLKANYWEISFSLITESAAQTSDDEITTAFCNKLEETIAAQPAYWLWSHRRWKEY
jgi:lauroyl/myristoyl acyltransferase